MQERMKHITELVRNGIKLNVIVPTVILDKEEKQEAIEYLEAVAAKTDADIIVMCGVHFMAETAKILCPDKKVLIPAPEAGCSLADSCKAEDLAAWKAMHPDHMVVSYVNTSAAVKALTDVVVTSSNALKIVQQLPEDQLILFGPDQNLGGYINRMTGRKMDLWNGGCHVHARFSEEALLQLKAQYPNAKVLAHSECKQTILQHADIIGSTQALLNYAKESSADTQFIVATESGILHEMQKACPELEFIALPAENGACNECEYMRMCTLQNLLDCLQNENNEIVVDETIAKDAIRPIQRMLEMS